jgi:hypothetical protein
MNVLVRLRRFAGEHVPAVPRAKLRSAERRAQANAKAYEIVLAAVEARGPQGVKTDELSRSAALRSAAKVQLIHAHATFAELLSTGASVEEAATATSRKLLNAGAAADAAAFAEALAVKPETVQAGKLAAAIVALHRGLPELAWDEFRTVPTHAWRRHAAIEYLDSGFRQEPMTALRTARDLVAERAAELGPAEWYELLRHAYVLRDLPLARQAYDLLLKRAQDDPTAWPEAEVQIPWLRPWMDDAPSPTVPPPTGTVAFGLINYRQPGRSKTSMNIGDYVQTLAALGHLVRNQNLRFDGPADLVEFVSEMQQRVRPERRLDAQAGEVRLYTVNRDASTYEAFPEPTWMLAFGWYMHPLFKLRHDFPMHPKLRPIYVSFHCNKREMLTPAAIDSLRRYGPVGCRDWTTVDLLLSLDIPAFFSGCLTTTVDMLFPPIDVASQPAEPRTVYVDVRGAIPEGATTATQSYQEVKQRGFAENLRAAVALLEHYRRTYTQIVTSRLHCYLPARSLGLEVDFRPKNRADVRFNGLIDLEDTDFDAIRTDLLGRLEPVMAAIVSGKSEDEVYQLWRELCADDVKAAWVRHGAIGPTPAPPFDVAQAKSRILVASDTDGPFETHQDGQVVDVAIIAGPDDRNRLPVVVDSVLAHTTRAVHVWLLSRGYGPEERRQLSEAFPESAVSWLAYDQAETGAPTVPAGWDLVLLPELLVDVRRVVVLPPVAVVVGDIAELAEHPLDGHALAARSSVGDGLTSGFGVLYRAARRLNPRADLAHDLYRRLHARHVFDFDAFETDVLVLDLEAMRRDRFCPEFLPYAGEFGFTPREVLTFYAGPNRAVLPPLWAHIPGRERVDDPRLVYWPEANAPWRRRCVGHREVWTTASERAARRVGGATVTATS